MLDCDGALGDVPHANTALHAIGAGRANEVRLAAVSEHADTTDSGATAEPPEGRSGVPGTVSTPGRSRSKPRSTEPWQELATNSLMQCRLSLVSSRRVNSCRKTIYDPVCHIFFLW